MSNSTGAKVWRNPRGAVAEPDASPHTREVTTTAEPEVALSVAEAAARVGLTPATLRTWHRRYGLAPSLRTAGGHRRYNATDIARLRVVQQMVDGGVPPGEAVAASLELAPDSLPDASARRRGGGNVVSLPGGDDVQRGLARAAVSLDGAAITERVSELLAQHGVVATWEDVLVPVLAAIGDRWYRTQRGIEIEHVASDAVARALQTHGDLLRADQRPVLLACMPQELHTLPLMALQAALRDARQPSVMLGARVPPDALYDAVRKVRPRRVVLWAQMAESGDRDVAGALPSQRPPAKIVLAGPGWCGDAEPVPGAAYPQSLREAVDLIVA